MSRNDALKQVPDLRLTLGDLEIPRLNLVVGANAASRADMSTFVASDTLCELEWSRRKGLIIRYAVCGVPEKSSFSTSAGPSNMVQSSLHAAETENDRDKIAEERPFVRAQTASKDAALSIPLKISDGQTPACKSGLEDGRVQKFSPESSSQCRGLNQSKTLKKEDGKEHGKEQVCLEVYEISKASPIRAFASGRKGKEKEENDDSYRSSESYNGTGTCLRKKRVMSFEEQLIVGSKRLKMQVQETHGSSRSNSSFANWISTMITGLPDASKSVLSSVEEDSKLASMGFETLFESIYQPKLKAQDERSLRSKNHSCEANNNAVVMSNAVKQGSTLIRNGSTNLQKDDDAPSRIFEAVKSLRLSRTDVMKWMNSMFSSALDGYYLRLRVGKSRQGLEGPSYQVACICSSEGGNLAETSKRPISVIVGGVKCLVECQYISNQDFLEDELKAWWTATQRDDEKIPSEDELRSKVEERRRLRL